MEDWKKDLIEFFTKKEEKNMLDEEDIKPKKAEAERFFASVIIPVFEEVKAELKKYGREVIINARGVQVSIIVKLEDKEEFSYELQAQISQERVSLSENHDAGPIIKLQNLAAFQGRAISDISKEDIRWGFLEKYMRYVRLH